MRSPTRTFRLAAAFLLLAGSAGAQGKPMRVLFIGNSYTYFNNLAASVQDFAAERKESRPFEPTVVLIGGATLTRHITGPDALRLLKQGGWDYVVLQEQSELPLRNAEAFWREAKAFGDSAATVGAKVLMYETWAREASPQLQDSLTRSYHKAAELARGKVVHVGEAWAAFRSTEKVEPPAHSALFIADGSHPTTAGTYLAAASFYSVIYGKSPEGLSNSVRSTRAQPVAGPAPTDTPRETIPLALAKSLQKLAGQAAQK